MVDPSDGLLAMPVPATVDVVPGAELSVAAVSPVSLDGDLDLSLAQFLRGPTGSSSVPVGRSAEVNTSARGVNVTFHEAVRDVPAPSRVDESDPPTGTSSGVIEKFEEKSSWILCRVESLGNACQSLQSLLGQSDDCGQLHRRLVVINSILRVIICLII